MQKYQRKQNNEKRRHLVEDRGVAEREVINGVEVAENADRTRKRPADKQRQVFLFKMKFTPVFYHYRESEEKRNKIAEKAFFGRGKISRQSDEHIHKRETECRDYNQYYSLVLLVYFIGYRNTVCP